MLCVREVTKRYGDRTVLDRITFEAARGEVVGFLGPNGAGKTTAMRVITGYLRPSSGSVTIGGHDVVCASRAARRLLGYMPEHAPLYDDLRVEEYLRLRARLKGVGGWRRRRAEVARVLDLCALAPVRRRLIGQLSRGYRQRVGLADALLGAPPLLVLDEPTAGLDPNQVREVRALLRALGKEHTVLLSTHLLTEAEAVCSRVLIVHGERILYEQAVDAAGGGEGAAGRRLRFEVVGPGPQIEAVLRGIAGIRAVVCEELGAGAYRFRIEQEPERDVREALGRAALEHGWVVRALEVERASLEALFVRLTAKEPGVGEGAARPGREAAGT